MRDMTRRPVVPLVRLNGLNRAPRQDTGRRFEHPRIGTRYAIYRLVAPSGPWPQSLGNQMLPPHSRAAPVSSAPHGRRDVTTATA